MRESSGFLKKAIVPTRKKHEPKVGKCKDKDPIKQLHKILNHFQIPVRFLRADNSFEIMLSKPLGSSEFSETEFEKRIILLR